MEDLRWYDYRIEPTDVDFTGRATIMALGKYVFQAAAEDANKHGLGVQTLNKNQASWVLSRFAMEMERMPREEEHLRVHTWVNDIGRVMTTRNFLVLDADGNVVAKSVSNWAMMDLDARKALDLSALEQYAGMVQNIPSPIELPQRLKTPEGNIVDRHRIVYSDIDFNNHANTLKYLSWVVDTLPLEDIVERGFRRVDINFIREARYGQTVTIVANPELRLFELTSDDTTACRIALTVKEL